VEVAKRGAAKAPPINAKRGGWAIDELAVWDGVMELAKLWAWVVTSLTVFTFSGIMRRFTFRS
jgi:hypothetical protein